MATLEDIKTPWTNCSFDEKLEIIKRVRWDRQTTKPARTKAIKERREKKSGLLRLLQGLSQEELAILEAKVKKER